MKREGESKETVSTPRNRVDSSTETRRNERHGVGEKPVVFCALQLDPLRRRRAPPPASRERRLLSARVAPFPARCRLLPVWPGAPSPCYWVSRLLPLTLQAEYAAPSPVRSQSFPNLRPRKLLLALPMIIESSYLIIYGSQKCVAQQQFCRFFVSVLCKHVGYY